MNGKAKIQTINFSGKDDIINFVGKSVYFTWDGTEQLILDNEGFHYRGQSITDAGEAYMLFMRWLKNVNETEVKE